MDGTITGSARLSRVSRGGGAADEGTDVMLTTGGLILLILILMIAFNMGGRIGLLVAAVLGAALPLAGQIASGVGEVSASLAPVFNSLGGGV